MIEATDVTKTVEKQKRAKKLAYFLLLYLIVVTVAVVWLGVKIIKTPTPVCASAPAEEVQAEPRQVTNASWYDYELNGIPWSLDHRTGASREFARGTMVEVTNIANGKSVEVLINDFGPEYAVHPDRELDLSSFAFAQIADLQEGVVSVEYRAVGTGEYRPLTLR